MDIKISTRPIGAKITKKASQKQISFYKFFHSISSRSNISRSIFEYTTILSFSKFFQSYQRPQCCHLFDNDNRPTIRGQKDVSFWTITTDADIIVQGIFQVQKCFTSHSSLVMINQCNVFWVCKWKRHLKWKRHRREGEFKKVEATT